MKDSQIGFRAPLVLREQLEEIAKKDNRTLSTLIVIVLNEFVDKHFKKDNKKEN
jgi:hypothetical protein